jgi:hypothetical protein
VGRSDPTIGMGPGATSADGSGRSAAGGATLQCSGSRSRVVGGIEPLDPTPTAGQLELAHVRSSGTQIPNVVGAESPAPTPTGALVAYHTLLG